MSHAPHTPGIPPYILSLDRVGELSIAKRAAVEIGIALAATAVLTLSAKTQVPFWPAPFTLQSLAVVMLGALLGPWRAGGAIALYLAEGAAGLPVFAHGGGAAYFTGPTGGYLIGFLIGGVATGALCQAGFARNEWTIGLCLFAGMMIVSICGVAYLTTMMGLDDALWKGMALYLPSDLLKAAIGAITLAIWARRSPTAGNHQ